jgi:hypothetical protein
MDPQKGRYFVLQKVRPGKSDRIEPVFRADVRKGMEAKGAGLVVIMSDCCSERLEVQDLPIHRPVEVIHYPAVRCLFFQHRGVVDITAAADETGSWGDQRGGVFTRAFCEAMKPANFPKLDQNHDKFVTWKEFFPTLKVTTEAFFESFAKTARAHNKFVDQKTQSPRALSLGEPKPVAKVEAFPPELAVFRLVNAFGKPLKYRYRLAGGDWKEGELENGGKIQHALPAEGADSAGTLIKIEFEGQAGAEKLTSTLNATVWIGADPADKPPPNFGREYRLFDKK